LSHLFMEVNWLHLVRLVVIDLVKSALYQHYAAQERMQTCWQKFPFAGGRWWNARPTN
jgi:hypothetical protein